MVTVTVEADSTYSSQPLTIYLGSYLLGTIVLSEANPPTFKGTLTATIPPGMGAGQYSVSVWEGYVSCGNPATIMVTSQTQKSEVRGLLPVQPEKNKHHIPETPSPLLFLLPALLVGIYASRRSKLMNTGNRRTFSES
jgi:hypothetical protein